MNIAAFLLALAAILCFLWDLTPHALPRRPLVPVGLACFVAAFATQLIWVTHHIVQIK